MFLTILTKRKNVLIPIVCRVLFVFGFLAACTKQDSEMTMEPNFNDEQVVVPIQSLSLQSESARGFTKVYQTKFLPIYHWWEMKDRTDGNFLCGQTCYMVALKTIATKNGLSYTMSKSEQDKIWRGTAKSPNPYQLYNYWKKNHSNYVACDFARGPKQSPDRQNWTTREKIKEFIEKALSEGKLVLMPVFINGHGARNWRSDATRSDPRENMASHYITRNGNIGHWIVIWRLDVYRDVNGNVTGGKAYYVDVLEPNVSDAQKTVDYSRLLDSNHRAGSTHSAMWFTNP